MHMSFRANDLLKLKRHSLRAATDNLAVGRTHRLYLEVQMRYIAAAIVMLAGAIAAGLGSVSANPGYRSGNAQELGIALIVGGAAVFIFDFVRELRAKDQDNN